MGLRLEATAGLRAMNVEPERLILLVAYLHQTLTKPIYTAEM